jgi:hypothetical protein
MHIEAGHACARARRVLYEIDVFDVRLAIVVRHGLTENATRPRLFPSLRQDHTKTARRVMVLAEA